MSRSVENPSPRCEKSLGIVPDIFLPMKEEYQQKIDKCLLITIISDEKNYKRPQVYKLTTRKFMIALNQPKTAMRRI